MDRRYKYEFEIGEAGVERALVVALRGGDISIAAVEIERVEVPEEVRAFLADLRWKGTENDVGSLAVDEIDASLHPHLVEVALQMFADPEINTSGAQLVFTSHDTYILSPLSDIELAPEQIWFTEKSGEGVTEL